MLLTQKEKRLHEFFFGVLTKNRLYCTIMFLRNWSLFASTVTYVNNKTIMLTAKIKLVFSELMLKVIERLSGLLVRPLHCELLLELTCKSSKPHSIHELSTHCQSFL